MWNALRELPHARPRCSAGTPPTRRPSTASASACTCPRSARRPAGWRSGCPPTTSVRPPTGTCPRSIGLFPGDRIRPDGSTPAEIVAGATALLTARGMDSFGWANAWRSLCWARLKDADKAYQLIVNNLRPSTERQQRHAPEPLRHLRGGHGPRHLPDRRELRHPRGDRRDAALLPARPHRTAAGAARRLGGRRLGRRRRASAAASSSTSAGGTASRPRHGSAASAAAPRQCCVNGDAPAGDPAPR